MRFNGDLRFARLMVSQLRHTTASRPMLITASTSKVQSVSSRMDSSNDHHPRLVHHPLAATVYLFIGRELVETIQQPFIELRARR